MLNEAQKHLLVSSMDLRHYDSNGLELSSIPLFKVGLIAIVIKKVISVGMTISYSIASDAWLFTDICPLR